MDNDNELYTSISVILSPSVDPSESASLLSSNIKRKNRPFPSFKSFIISAVLIIFFGASAATAGIFFYHHNMFGLGVDNGMDHEFIDEDAGCATSDIDCNGHGICSALTNSCECDIGYTSIGSEDGTECNYKQKYQMNAFLLSLFLGEFGAGRYYVGDYVLGTIKLLLIFIGCCVACCAMMSAAGSDSKGLMAFGYIALLCSACGLGIWC